MTTSGSSGTRLLVGAIVVVSVAVVAIWTPGLLVTPTPEGSTPVPHNHRYVIRASDPDIQATALIAQVNADRAGRTEIHWTNEASWRRTSAVVLRNIRFHSLTPVQVSTASYAWERDTTCEHPAATAPGECEATSVSRDGGFLTRGRIAEGGDLWYAAAFGADDATLAIEAHTEHPLKVEWVQETETRLDMIATPGHANGRVNISLSRPNYGVLVMMGSFNESPVVRIEGDTVEYRFHREDALWRNSSGDPVVIPGFPLPAGTYSVRATGGTTPADPTAERPAVALARIVDPRFVESDGTFISVDDRT